MDGFTYSNIFETKGIEYIIIIFFLLILIPFWIFVNREGAIVKQIQQTVSALTTSVLRIPQGLFFSKNHTWLHMEKSGQTKIGIDDFLLRVVGNVKVNTLKQPGNKVMKGDIIALIEQEGKQLKMHSPISGEIVNINETIQENEGLLTADPYGEGWLFTMNPSDWKRETTGFFLAEEATRWISSELQRMKDFLTISLSKHTEESIAVVFQEGGELQMNPLDGLQPEIWNDFQQQFLEQTG